MKLYQTKMKLYQTKMKLISLVIPLDIKRKKLWFQVRESKDELNGLLEFPGGKIEDEEKPIDAAIREVKEEVGVELDSSSLKLVKIHHHTKVDNFIFYIFICTFQLDLFKDVGWRDLCELDGLEIPPENKIFLADILKTL